MMTGRGYGYEDVNLKKGENCRSNHECRVSTVRGTWSEKDTA